MIENSSEFTPSQIDALLATAARLLIRQQHVRAASLLANAPGRLDPESHDNWNGGQDTWLLALFVPAEVFLELPQRDEIEAQIGGALTTAVKALSDRDFFVAKILAALEEDPEWRAKVTRHLAGAGITNQGRVRSDNIAARQFEGLLFRSAPEVEFYKALKKAGVAFAPLSVVLKGGVQYRRAEPDFILFKEGQVMIVEIDGDLYHTESPAAGHARLKFLLDEGAKLERITAEECDTPDKAREAVARVLLTMEKHRRAR